MLKCAKCKWEWNPRRGRKEPETCPNPLCRTRLWKGTMFRGKPDRRNLDYDYGQPLEITK